MIHRLPELPKEGTDVFVLSELSCCIYRCIYEAGKFISPAESFVVELEVADPVKWFYEKEYAEYFKKEGISSYFVSFENAERIGCMKDIENILRVVTETENACVESGIYPGLTIRDNVIDLGNKLHDLKRKLEENINAS